MRTVTSLQPRWKPRPRRRREIAALVAQRRAWLATLAPECLFHKLFDYLPGVFFFAKDRDGRIMFVSRGIPERYRMQDETEMLGLTDFDINPGSMAEVYVHDDDRLLTGAAKRIERLELWFDRQGMPDWYAVTKLPVLDRRGRPAGVMGVLRRRERDAVTRLPDRRPGGEDRASPLCQTDPHRAGRPAIRTITPPASAAFPGSHRRHTARVSPANQGARGCAVARRNRSYRQRDRRALWVRGRQQLHPALQEAGGRFADGLPPAAGLIAAG
jgi:hypothetical protein